MTDYIAEAIKTAWGKRCEAFDADCPVCLAWRQYDDWKIASDMVMTVAKDLIREFRSANQQSPPTPSDQQ